MKKQMTMALLGMVLISACKKESATPANNTPSNTSAVVEAGTWVVSSFTEKAEDKTASFAGIDFTFKSDGTLTATGNKTTTGTWIAADPVTGYYGSPSSVATFTISAGNDNPFNRLNSTWNVIEQTASTIKLDDREASEDKHVTFTKK